MTKRTQQWQKWVQMPLAAAIAVGFASPVSAFSFNVGDVDGAFDTRVTAAVGWRTQSQDKDLIGQGNLDGVSAGDTVGASTTNYDDGNLNFDRGETYSQIIRGSSELYLNQDFRGQYLDRVGGFARGRYWYDFRIKNRNFERDGRETISEDGKDNAAGGELLDAYVWTDWFVNNVPVSLRYGRQVFNWGESTFIQGGINASNPIDVGAIRSPGAELREALLPIEAFYASAGVTENLTVEGYLQFDWEPIRPDDCGTFFSDVDFAADGCGPVYGNGTISEAQADMIDADPSLPATRLEREGDRRPDGEDQYGVGLQYYAAGLGETEFGLYHIRYHSRLPYTSGFVNNNPPGEPNDPQDLPNYFVEYPEGIKMYGVSLNTNLPGGWSLGAEYSFRENLPIQWNAFELITGGVQQPYSLVFQDKTDGGDEDKIEALQGQAVDGFERFKYSQAQATFIRFFDRLMGASRMSFVGEIGATYVHGLPDQSEARFGRSGTFGIGDFEDKENRDGDLVSCEDVNINPSNCTNDGFVTDFAWGYRMLFQWEYNNVVFGTNVKPRIAWSHDVKGNSPEPGGAFSEGEKAITLGVTFDYQNTVEAGLSYTNFFGGDYNTFADRDHLTASISYAF